MDVIVDHISYSSMKLLASNPWLFKKKYILGLWDIRPSVSSVVGRAFHKYAELKYNGIDFDTCMLEAIKVIDAEKNIEYGKTGSLQKLLATFEQVVTFWEAYEWRPNVVLATEKANVVPPDFSGQLSPVALKAVTDLVEQKEDGIHLHDWKTVTSFTTDYEENPSYIIQALFNFYTNKGLYNSDPISITYHEIKKTKNKSGDPQIKAHTIVYADYPQYFAYFAELYTQTLHSLALMTEYDLFLPNFYGYDGLETWRDFVVDCESKYED